MHSSMTPKRRRAESRHFDTCRITRGVGDVVTDPDTGEVTVTPNTVYEGRCRVQTWEAQEANPEAGDAVLTTQRYRVDVRAARTADDYAPQIGDDVLMVEVELDPHLAGRTFGVAALLHKTEATAYRLGVTDGP